MASRPLLLLALVGLLASCGGSNGSQESVAGAPSGAEAELGGKTPAPAPAAEPPAKAPPSKAAEEVVRAWSEALNAGDNERAAELFADGAVVLQGEVGVVLRDRADAVNFNRALPCSGEIARLSIEGSVVTAVFTLGDRTTGSCDAPAGTEAAAQFVIDRGKIVVWRQIPVPASQEPEPEPDMPPAAA